MTYEEYYGDAYPMLEEAEKCLLDVIDKFPSEKFMEGIEPVIYTKSRIKTPDSMIGKLKRMNLPTDRDTALREMHDTVGARVVCSFVDNVYQIADWLCGQPEFELIERKDYISYPKPNGYRSLHLILKLKGEKYNGLLTEIQLRTIAIDFWAALEHQIKYKHNIRDEKLAMEELKRCADEIASVDMSMQTIRDVIR